MSLYVNMLISQCKRKSMILLFRIFKHLVLNKASDALYLRFNTHAAGICTLAMKLLLLEGEVINKNQMTCASIIPQPYPIFFRARSE